MNKRQAYKKYLCTWCIAGYYLYQIYEITNGNDTWLEATPQTKGVTRIANTENVLREILTEDAASMNAFWKKVR